MPDVSGWNNTSQPHCGEQAFERCCSTRKRVQPKNRMRENCTSGSVRGAPGNRRSYRRGVKGTGREINPVPASVLPIGLVSPMII